MIDLIYLKRYLEPKGYQIYNDGQFPVFYKRVMHQNPSSLYAFTLIMVTLDKYTVTIEGMNEILITRAVKAKAIEINDYEELDALREIVYDDTLEEVKNFERIFTFFELQIQQIMSHGVQSEAHQQALENIELMVENANRAEY